jgi:hypothetical protein
MAMTEAYLEGWEGYCWGFGVMENPYLYDTEEYEDWSQGWHDARAED